MGTTDMPMTFPPASGPATEQLVPASEERAQISDDRAFFETFLGNKFYPLNVTPEDIHLVEIAHATSMLCRYNRHCQRFYSVAEHSVHLARYCERKGMGASAAAVMLLHDAPEAYSPFGDVARPIKEALRSVGFTMLDDLEDTLQCMVYTHFGLLDIAAHGLPLWVKQLDSRIIVDERKVLMRPTDNPWTTDGLEALDVRIECWEPRRAKQEFMGCAYRYGLAAA